MARSVCTPPATRSYAKGSHPMSPVSKLSYESYSSNLVEHVRMLQNWGPFELPLKWRIWVRNKSEFEWGTPTAGWVLAHNFSLHHIPRQKSVTCTWVRGRTQSWRTLSGLKDELDNTSATKRGSWVDSLSQSMGNGSVDGWQWSSKSSWWNWSKLKLAVLTTCYVHHETGSRCSNPHGIPLLWPRLLPFMCTWLHWTSKMDLLLRTCSIYVKLMIQRLASSFLSHRHVCSLMSLSILSSTNISGVGAVFTGGGQRKKCGQSLCCCLRMGEVFKDGRGESPQLHGVKQRCTKKKKTKSAMWQYHFFVEFLASDTTFLHGWLQLKDVLCMASEWRPHLRSILSSEAGKRGISNAASAFFWMVREWGHSIFEWLMEKQFNM